MKKSITLFSFILISVVNIFAQIQSWEIATELKTNVACSNHIMSNDGTRIAFFANQDEKLILKVYEYVDGNFVQFGSDIVAITSPLRDISFSNNGDTIAIAYAEFPNSLEQIIHIERFYFNAESQNWNVLTQHEVGPMPTGITLQFYETNNFTLSSRLADNYCFKNYLYKGGNLELSDSLYFENSNYYIHSNYGADGSLLLYFQHMVNEEDSSYVSFYSLNGGYYQQQGDSIDKPADTYILSKDGLVCMIGGEDSYTYGEVLIYKRENIGARWELISTIKGSNNRRHWGTYTTDMNFDGSFIGIGYYSGFSFYGINDGDYKLVYTYLNGTNPFAISDDGNKICYFSAAFTHYFRYYTLDYLVLCENDLPYDYNGKTIPVGTNSGRLDFSFYDTMGNDSLVSITLTVNKVNTEISLTDTTLTTTAVNAEFQWLDCQKNYSQIIEANSNSFTPLANGNYAVQITQNGCIDTSSCYPISGFTSLENEFDKLINLYPNPTNEKIKIDLNKKYNAVTIKLKTATGQIVSVNTYKQVELINYSIEEPPGLYILDIELKQGNHALIKIIKY